MSRERARGGLAGQSRLARVQCEGGVVTSDPSSSEIDRERRRRRDEEQLRARESRPHHIVTAHELDQETEDGVGEEVDPEQIAGHAHVRAAPPPQPAEHRALERALVKERRMTRQAIEAHGPGQRGRRPGKLGEKTAPPADRHGERHRRGEDVAGRPGVPDQDRKSTRLNSSHTVISYAVFCLKKKKTATLMQEITTTTATT